jgi:hypothetical protein
MGPGKADISVDLRTAEQAAELKRWELICLPAAASHWQPTQAECLHQSWSLPLAPGYVPVSC